MRIVGFFDNSERKEILELAKAELKSCEWVSSGSMLLLKTEDKNEFEVYVLRGLVTLSKKDLKQMKEVK